MSKAIPESHVVSATQPSEAPRVCIYSLRDIENHVSRACGYEFEDVIATSLDTADIIQPRHKGHSLLRLKAKRWLSRRTPAANLLNSGLDVRALEQDYDLFFFSAALPLDLDTLSALKGWRERSNYAVCWLQEFWIGDIETYGPQLDKLNNFDHVICSFHDSVEPLRKRLSVPVSYLPWGIDAVLFCPYPASPPRVIETYAIGAISDATHNALVDYAEKTGRFYAYDTIRGLSWVTSHTEHRRNYSGILKRSQYFFSYVAKVHRTTDRGTQAEFGLRFLEATAAGAILLGDRLSTQAFEDHLGWEDSVIPVPYECPDIASIIEDLNRQPERLAEARRQNIQHGLRQHDHLYRWEKVLEISGLSTLPKMGERRKLLASLADTAEVS